MVTIIEVSALQRSEEETMDHVTEEICLLRLGAFGHGDVWKHLLLEDFLRIAKTPLTVETRGRSTVADVVQCDLYTQSER